MDIYSQKVIDSFFQQFYDERVEIAKRIGEKYHNQLDISLLSFWFSVIDFYGGIYQIGIENKKPYRNGTFNLATKKAFTSFIKTFFPAPENNLGEFLYTIFRSGIVHQLSPKKGGILWDNQNSDLLWMEIDKNNPDNNSNKVAKINIFQLEKLAFDSYKEFRRKVENDELVTECENIFNHLLKDPDGLEDGKTIHIQYEKLEQKIKDKITK